MVTNLTPYKSFDMQAVLKAISGITLPHPLAPSKCTLSDKSESESDFPWPIARVFREGKPIEINDLRDESLPGGSWPEYPTEVVAHPIFGTSYGEIVGVIVLGVCPRRRLDDMYRNFHLLISRQLANNLSAARSYEEERQKREALAEIGELA